MNFCMKCNNFGWDVPLIESNHIRSVCCPFSIGFPARWSCLFFWSTSRRRSVGNIGYISSNIFPSNTGWPFILASLEVSFSSQIFLHQILTPSGLVAPFRSFISDLGIHFSCVAWSGPGFGKWTFESYFANIVAIFCQSCDCPACAGALAFSSCAADAEANASGSW